jgi:hypothetical protein
MTWGRFRRGCLQRSGSGGPIALDPVEAGETAAHDLAPDCYFSSFKTARNCFIAGERTLFFL